MDALGQVSSSEVQVVLNCRQHSAHGQIVCRRSPGHHRTARMSLMLCNDQPMSVLFSIVALACIIILTILPTCLAVTTPSSSSF